MDTGAVSKHRPSLIDAIPEVDGYIRTFRSINKRWEGAITAGLIETGRMEGDARVLFGPLIQDMGSTKFKYSHIQGRLVDAILFEMVKKAVAEIKDAAKFVVNILKRNLFERTADVGYLATDAEIVDFLRLARQDQNLARERAGAIRSRLNDYQYEYTVYNEIIILDRHGIVQANLDANNSAARSCDALLTQTQAIDMHDAACDKYVETFRESDLRPGKGQVLIYSQKILDPETHESLGTLCLCFDFKDEMERIFKDLNQGQGCMVLALIDETGRVLDSSSTSILDKGEVVQVDLEEEFRFMEFKGRSYLVRLEATDGYQGFFGLTWYGLAMMDASEAFRQEAINGGSNGKGKANGNGNGNGNPRCMHSGQQIAKGELAEIKTESDDLLADMKLDSINGQVKAAKFAADGFVEVLRFVNLVGDEIDGLFSVAIGNLQHTVSSSLLCDVQFRAFQGNNIADRNLYERANDVCWWALTPMFRSLMTKHTAGGLDEEERQALTANLQYINDLYTPYLRLVLADLDGVVIAASSPPAGLNERIVKEGLPSGQGIVGMRLDKELVAKALSLASSRDYCVSDFEPTPLYGGRPTYVYSTAIRSKENEDRPVGVIQIVFDSEPQFEAMLADTLPRSASGEILAGSLGLFADRNKRIVSSTSADYPPGSDIELPDDLFAMKNGERDSRIVEMNGKLYAIGAQVSDGYREYKRGDGYENDIVCIALLPL